MPTPDSQGYPYCLIFDTLGFDGEIARGERRQGLFITDPPPAQRLRRHVTYRVRTMDSRGRYARSRITEPSTIPGD